jgi:RNA polymerase subunit RPABC4/transcription elongation factor Spt4
VHIPLVHICPVAHARPHAPQWAVLVLVFTQAPLHTVWPAGHAHVPPEHDCPLAHTTPQPPQLFTSVVTLMHDAPQSACPEGHTQVPDEHVCPVAHARLHVPQWVVLVLVLTSQPSLTVPLQLAKPDVHAPMPQVLAAQVCTLTLARLHTMPQPPQLRGSVLVLTHAPEQLVVPPPHESVQTPAAQT